MSAVYPPLVGNLTLVDLLLWLAPVLIVPLGIRLLPFQGPRARQLLSAARVLQPIGAATAIVSFLFTPGMVAGAIALGWLISCGVMSLAGLVELIERRSLRPIQLVPAAAVAYLSVGAGWLVVSRAGIRPLGFSQEIVELTGVHFHYAGFAATLMAALAVVALRDRGKLATLGSAAALLVVAGVPITAGGIATRSGLLTIVGPVLLATGVLTIAALTAVAIAPRIESAMARWLLWLSAAGGGLPRPLAGGHPVSGALSPPAPAPPATAPVPGRLHAPAVIPPRLLGLAPVRPRRENRESGRRMLLQRQEQR